MVRFLLRRHYGWAMLLLAAALCLRGLVPAGYMLADTAQKLQVVICGEGLSGHDRQIVLPRGPSSRHGELPGNAAKADEPCPYSVLALASLGGAEPALLALALLFVLALGYCAQTLPRPRSAPRLWPPMRGPPSFV